MAFLMPAALLPSSSVIIELCLTMISPVFGSISSAYLPTRRSSSFQYFIAVSNFCYVDVVGNATILFPNYYILHVYQTAG